MLPQEPVHSRPPAFSAPCVRTCHHLLEFKHTEQDQHTMREEPGHTPHDPLFKEALSRRVRGLVPSRVLLFLWMLNMLGRMLMLSVSSLPQI